VTAPTPTPAPAAAEKPVTDQTKDEKKNDAVDKLISQLGNAARPGLGGGGMPFGGGMPLGGGMPFGGGGVPLGGGMPLGGGSGGQSLTPKSTPLSTSRTTEPEKRPTLSPATSRPAEEPAKLVDKKEAAAAAPLVGPTASTKGAAPGAGATPEGDPKTASAGKADSPNTTTVKGTKVEFPDAKTAKLVSVLATGTPENPVGLAEAASKAGLVPPVPGQDPGQMVDPGKARPGDVLVAGDKNYVLLGDGKFYDYAAQKVVDSSKLPDDLGAGGGYFHLRDSEAAAAPVSEAPPSTVPVTVTAPPAVSDPPPSTPITPGGPSKTDSAPVGTTDTATGRSSGVTVAQKPMSASAVS
jgi:hypothetical protein